MEYRFKAAPFRISFRLPFRDAIRSAEARAPRAVLPEEYYGDAMDDARRTAWTVSGLAGLGQVRAVLDSLTQAQRDGVGFGAWAKQAQTEGWGLDRNRAELIFRMQAQTSYSAGHWRRFEENVEARPFLMYSAVNDERTRPAHRAMSGFVAHKRDPVWKQWTPPVGFNCRCALLDLTEAQARERGYPMGRPPAAPDPGFERAGTPMDAEEAARRYFTEQADTVQEFAVAAAEFLNRMPPRLSTEVRAALPPGLYEQLEAFVRAHGIDRQVAGADTAALVAWQAQIRTGWHETTAALSGGRAAVEALERAGGIIVATLSALLAQSKEAAQKYLRMLEGGERLPDGRTPVEWLRERFPQFRDIEQAIRSN